MKVDTARTRQNFRLTISPLPPTSSAGFRRRHAPGAPRRGTRNCNNQDDDSFHKREKEGERGGVVGEGRGKRDYASDRYNFARADEFPDFGRSSLPLEKLRSPRFIHLIEISHASLIETSRLFGDLSSLFFLF